uniref:Forkhead box H1 n=1 Tax=Varanus komodoensis TaxID=61221 RepID=A0A8D2IWV8_VARKO
MGSTPGHAFPGGGEWPSAGAPAGREAEGQAGQLGRRGKKKKYHRHPKPPYTYLAMIALVIQASPERKLKLSQIIREISTLFPFFKDNYQGWKDSIRHNLSSNECFYKVLKDPKKPKAKGNFWTVDVERIPPEALKLQNTPVSRQEERVFAVDLAPYVFHGWPFSSPPPPPPPPHDAASSGGSLCPATGGGRQSSPFSIDALLSDFQDVGLCGKPRGAAESPPTLAAGLDTWGTVPLFHATPGPPVVPWQPPWPLPACRPFSSSSSSLSSLGSLSPREREAQGQRPGRGPGLHALPKRPRGLRAPESSSSDSEDGAPPHAAPPWEQLPTSYSTGVPPNVVAPPSLSPPFPTALLSLPIYSPAPLAAPARWELAARPPPSPGPPAQLSADLDQTAPPNKTVFDAWLSRPTDTAHPALGRAGPLPSRPVLAHYEPLARMPH